MPDYKQIYSDILTEKFPEKLIDSAVKRKLETLDSAIDVLKFNQLILVTQTMLLDVIIKGFGLTMKNLF